MIVVSDTSPLNYLIQLGQIDIVFRLYGAVYIPTTVLHELSDARAPASVRAWSASPPAWLQVRSAVTTSLDSLLSLDRGERDAISLALSMGASTILADDMRARLAANDLKLKGVATLLLLDAAADRGWLDLNDCIEQLRKTNFRVREQTLVDLLKSRSVDSQ